MCLEFPILSRAASQNVVADILRHNATGDILRSIESQTIHVRSRLWHPVTVLLIDVFVIRLIKTRRVIYSVVD
jgi:hypothetical protein